MKDELTVTILDQNPFYSLYSDGKHSWKSYDNKEKSTHLVYAKDSLIILYYTYPTHREACVIRNTVSGVQRLPGLSKNVSVLFSVHASRVDKLRRAVSFLRKPLSFDDGFYTRLYFILLSRGKLNYPALRSLAEQRSLIC
jgi:hypothetical protein